MKSITESSSHYHALESRTTLELIEAINREDAKVAAAVREKCAEIARLVDQIYERFSRDGRLLYIGAGTSGRLGILDASEIPPTFGIPADRVIGLIAGGDKAIRTSVESAEDHPEQAKKDLAELAINQSDTVIGIAASGTTPYVISGLKYAKSCGALTACITNNSGTPLARVANYPIELIVGPEVVTGSTRMKSGTAQKMVLNMISTTLMIRMGRVKGNKMINMQLSNDKLIDRGIRMLMDELKVSRQQASGLLKQFGSVSAALENFKPT